MSLESEFYEACSRYIYNMVVMNKNTTTFSEKGKEEKIPEVAPV